MKLDGKSKHEDVIWGAFAKTLKQDGGDGHDSNGPIGKSAKKRLRAVIRAANSELI